MEQGYDIAPSDYVRDAFSLFQQRAGMFIGYGFVGFFITFFSSIILSFLPIIGGFLGQSVNTTLLAGHLQAGHQLVHEQRTEFSDFFRPFEKFVPILTYTLIVSMIFFVPFLAIFVSVIGFDFTLLSDPTLLSEQMEAAMTGGSALIAIVGFLFIFALGVYVGVSYTLVIPLILFDELSAWNAMEASRMLVGKKFGSVVVLLILLFFVNMLGVLLFGIGLLVSIPVSYLAMYLFYAHLLNQSEGGDDFLSFDEDQPLDAGFR